MAADHLGSHPPPSLPRRCPRSFIERNVFCEKSFVIVSPIVCVAAPPPCILVETFFLVRGLFEVYFVLSSFRKLPMVEKRVYVLAPGGARARGGMGRMVAHLTRRLGAGPDLAVETIDTYGSRVNEARAKIVMPLYFALGFLRLLRACTGRRIALAHIHMAANGSVYRKSALMLLCRGFGVPVILHIHGGDLDRFCAALGPLRLGLLRWILGAAAEVIVLGAYWRTFVIARLGVAQERVTILYNGVPRPTNVAQADGGPVCEILFLGMVRREKGMGELLAALSLLPHSCPDWRMTIAGFGDIAEFAEEARRLGLGDRVAFLGWTDEEVTQQLLRRAAILVLPSHFECLPMCVIEAMAHGLAVVVTPVGAVLEAITDEETGLLVPVGDCRRLSQAILRLLLDPSLRRGLGARARARFCERFDLDIFERRMRDIYRKHMIAS
jgi:glycosyltransferase involved in cell wall biosynthesis